MRERFWQGEAMMTTKHRLCLSFAALGMLFSAVIAIPSCAQTAADDSMVFIHANLIDGISSATTMDATVVVANGHIRSIGHGAAPAGRGD
jgi:hypothetical protein